MHYVSFCTRLSTSLVSKIVLSGLLVLGSPLLVSTFLGTACLADSLQEKLDAKRDAGKSHTDPETKRIMADATSALATSGITAHAPKVGAILPDGRFISAKGEDTSLSKELGGAPAIVTFYRGGWCPYCNLQLHEYQQHLHEITELGAKLIAISPELPDDALSTKSKNDLEFVVLSDPNNTYARSLGIVFELNEELRRVYQKFGIDLPKTNGSKFWELPLAATFVVDRDRTVKHAFVDADYTKRAEPSDLLQSLRQIK